jgi:poly(A) polymerase/tRNA nucleotidyltransferase (CCA-adding enzyme)
MITEYLIDPFGGVNDLKNRLIRCVGNPIERLSEDGLRSVRGCRFAAQLQFDIHPETKDAMSKTLHITKHVSIERFRDELLKLLYKSPKPSVGINHMKDVGILEIFIPELLEGIGVEQPEFHTEDVYNHTLSAVDVAADNVKIAALFHDIAKPRTKSVDSSGIHFYGHDVKGAEMTRDIMKRLKFPNAVIEDTALLVKYHMFHYPSADWRKANLTMDDSSDHGWSDGAIRRLIKNVGGDEQIEKLLALRLADATSNKKAEYNRSELTLLSQRISEVRAASSAMSISDLDISGDVLMQHFGIKPSKMLGDILKTLLEKVIDNPTLNKRETLLELAEEFIKSKGDKSI